MKSNKDDVKKQLEVLMGSGVEMFGVENSHRPVKGATFTVAQAIDRSGQYLIGLGIPPEVAREIAKDPKFLTEIYENSIKDFDAYVAGYTAVVGSGIVEGAVILSDEQQIESKKKRAAVTYIDMADEARQKASEYRSCRDEKCGTCKTGEVTFDALSFILGVASLAVVGEDGGYLKKIVAAFVPIKQNFEEYVRELSVKRAYERDQKDIKK